MDISGVKSITIKIPLKKSKKRQPVSKNPNLEGHVEVKGDCLKYFHGCWLKCIKKQNGEYNSGGFLTKIMDNYIYLRSPHSTEPSEFYSKDYIFFVKRTSEQYISMQNIEIEREKNTIEKQRLYFKKKNLYELEKKIDEKSKTLKEERTRFERIRDTFLKLVEDGKAKIFI